MAWGALATGARAATGSTGQGLSLMQESFSEITLAELPLVIFNMARGQQDYFQATRGGGHGDYRHIVLAPQDVTRRRRARAARVPPRRQVAQPRARLRRLPARAHAGSDLDRADRVPRAARRRTGRSTAPLPAAARAAASRRSASARSASPRWARRARRSTSRPRSRCMEREVRVETGFLDDAETVIVAFGSPAKFVKYAIKQLRDAGHKIGYVRPITLWPFPYDDGRRRRGRPERAARRQLRALAPARWSTTCASASPAARPSRSSAASRPTTPGFGVGPHPRRRGHRRTHPRAARRPRAAAHPRLRAVLVPDPGAPEMTIIDTSSAPTVPARKVEAAEARPAAHPGAPHVPGCGEPLAVRQFLETIEELGVGDRTDRGRRHRLLHVVLRRRWTSISCRRCTAARRRSRPA